MIDTKKIAKGAAVDKLIDIIKTKADTGHKHEITDVTGLQEALDAKAEAEHSHEITDVTGLQEALNAKADKSDTYTKSEVDEKFTNIPSVYKTKGSKESFDEVLALTDAKVGDVWDVKAEFTYGGKKYPAGTNVVCTKDTSGELHDESCWDPLGGIFDTSDLAQKVHTHTHTDITDWDTELAKKANVEHTHDIEDVTGLQDALDAKAEKSHQHAHTDISDWDAEMLKKADAEHKHEIDDVNGLQDALDAKANATHSHLHTDISDWDDEMAKKADKSHTHETSEINGLDAKLAEIDNVKNYTVNGKKISSNPTLTADDIAINGFALSEETNDGLMPQEGDSTKTVFGKVYKAIQDNEEVTSAAFDKIRTTLGVSGTDFTMPDLSGTNYLSGLTVFVDIVKKLDTQLKTAMDTIGTLQSKISAIEGELANEITAKDIEAELGV